MMQRKYAIAFFLIVASGALNGMAEPEIHPVTPNWNPGPEYADNVRMWQGIPSIARAPEGRLWATWYSGGLGEGAENYVVLVTSDDDGRTWSAPQAIIDAPFRISEPALWLDPQGRLWFMWNQYPVHLRGENSQLWAMTTDNPDSGNPEWSDPRFIAGPYLNNFNKPTVLSDGRWLWPAGSWNTDVLSRPLFSSDNGKTFVPGGEIPIARKVRNFEEYQVVERTDGTLWLLTRAAGGMGESVSTDGGKTWSEVAPSSIQHTQSRFFITRLQSGKLLLVKHGPVDPNAGLVPVGRNGRKDLMAFLSDDDGQTWSDGLMLDERDEVSYPDGFQAPDGRIYITYDYSRHFEREILMAVFTEQDVAAGQLVSDEARLRVLINKATGTRTLMDPTPPYEAGAFELANNQDGVELDESTTAVIKPMVDGDTVGKLTIGSLIWRDRDLVFSVLPEALIGKQYMLTKLDGGRFAVEQEGYVYFIVRRGGSHNRLVEVGFEKTNLSEFIPLAMRDHYREMYGSSIYQKHVKRGEVVVTPPWSVAVFAAD
jgi:hypothetical protein